MLQFLVDLLIPPRRSEIVLRALTLEQVRALENGDGLPYHDPRVTALVWEVKYYKNRRALALCGELLAEKLLSAASEELGTPLLVPIPMHASRRRQRGHNQTESLCEAALQAGFTGAEYAPGALMRTRVTLTQQGLERTKRLKNIYGSMAADERVVRDRACIVLDDVSTTGATLEEARRALKAAGAHTVQEIVLARS